MNDYAIREAIAQTLGLDRHQPFRRATRRGVFSPTGTRLMYCVDPNRRIGGWADIPDYPNDALAMQKVVATLTGPESTSFALYLLMDIEEDDWNADEPLKFWEVTTAVMAAPYFWAKAYLRVCCAWVDDSELPAGRSTRSSDQCMPIGEAPGYYVWKDGRVTDANAQPVSCRPSPSGEVTIYVATARGHKTTFRVARLVGQAFCPDFRAELKAYHKDGDKDNCAADNLMWVPRGKQKT